MIFEILERSVVPMLSNANASVDSMIAQKGLMANVNAKKC